MYRGARLDKCGDFWLIMVSSTGMDLFLLPSQKREKNIPCQMLRGPGSWEVGGGGFLSTSYQPRGESAGLEMP